jgi:hypothetical protein
MPSTAFFNDPTATTTSSLAPQPGSSTDHIPIICLFAGAAAAFAFVIYWFLCRAEKTPLATQGDQSVNYTELEVTPQDEHPIKYI